MQAHRLDILSILLYQKKVQFVNTFLRAYLRQVKLHRICTKITPTLNAYSARQIGIGWFISHTQIVALMPNSAFQETSFLLVGHILSSTEHGLFLWV